MALEKAEITNSISGDTVAVMFNPEEYTLSKNINYAEAAVPGLRSPLLQFVHGQVQTLEMELLLDTYEAHGEGPRRVAAGTDVRTLVGQVTGLMAIDETTHAPPPLVFTWGSLSFTCLLTRVSEQYVMFLQSGIPVRARLQVSFSEFTNPERESKEVKRQTANYAKVHLVNAGDTLAGIATVHYENPELWRPIAVANELDDPRSIAVGQSLRVPSLPFTDPDTGELVS